MDSTSQEGNTNDLAVVESDPSGRYKRFDEIIGEGAWKKVYSGFDEFNGMQIAWSKEEFTKEISDSEETVNYLCAEARLLESLDHENIMICYKYWVDKDNKIINMITEFFSSGNLIDYIMKYDLVVKKMAIKKWCRQILQGLRYLHDRSLPIIHRDVKCENIFINGNTGKVKLGDFGLAMILKQQRRTFSGTAEYIAPELWGLEYDQLVDIYSFGMSVLQMVTRETPYKECVNNNQILGKILSGEMPEALSRVTDPEVKKFIEKCLVPASQRPSASELLNDPFLREYVHDQEVRLLQPAAPSVEIVMKIESEFKEFELQGKMKDNVSISMTLTIIDHIHLKKEKSQFEYSLETDTVHAVMEEMEIELELSAGDVALVTEIMIALIEKLNP